MKPSSCAVIALCHTFSTLENQAIGHATFHRLVSPFFPPTQCMWLTCNKIIIDFSITIYGEFRMVSEKNLKSSDRSSTKDFFEATSSNISHDWVKTNTAVFLADCFIIVPSLILLECKQLQNFKLIVSPGLQPEY